MVISSLNRVMGARDHFKNKANSRKLMSGVISILLAIFVIAMSSCNGDDKETVISVGNVTVTFQPAITGNSLTVGDKITATVTVTPENASNKSVTLTSSDNTVISVTPLAAPQVGWTLEALRVSESGATITAAAQDGSGKSFTSPAITVKAAPIPDFVVVVSGAPFTYDGTAKGTTVTVTAGSATLTAGTDYDLSYGESGNINTGEVTVTATGKGTYAGKSGNATFTIAPKADAVFVVTLSQTGYDYNAEERRPSVTVKWNETTLQTPADYTFAYDKNINVGTAEVNVAGAGNFAGSAGAGEFVIVPCTLKVVARNAERTYWDADPATLEWDVEKAIGYAPGDDGDMYPIFSPGLYGSDALAGELTRTKGAITSGFEAVGKYPITQGTLTGGSNYNIDYFQAGEFEIYYFKGDGETEAAAYEIGRAEHLAMLATLVNAAATNSVWGDKYYKLTTDINLNVAPYNTGAGWTPIGRDPSTQQFRGHFDGNGKIVSGLFINGGSGVGLFGYISGATVQNLGVEGSLTGGNYIGGLAGHIISTKITNCYAAVNVNSNNFCSGGLVGRVVGGSSITNCYTTGNVYSTNENVGGLVGTLMTGSSISNCYTTGEVSSAYRRFGGIVGGMGEGNVTNCAALNPSITNNGSGAWGEFNRVAGSPYLSTLSNNVAWEEMLVNGAKVTTGTATNANGADITTTSIKADGTLGGRFTTANGWTVENGKLPGFGAAIALPTHLQ